MPPNRKVNITVKVMSGMNTVSIAGLRRDITLVAETLEITAQEMVIAALETGDSHRRPVQLPLLLTPQASLPVLLAM